MKYVSFKIWKKKIDFLKKLQCFAALNKLNKWNISEFPYSFEKIFKKNVRLLLWNYKFNHTENS